MTSSPPGRDLPTGECKRFAVVAEEFCRWVEGAPGEPEMDLEKARSLAARLYCLALALPRVDASDQEDDVDPMGLEYEAAFKRFERLPVNMYACTDPLVVLGAECSAGDVADDLADTYLDVRRGLALYRAERIQAAVWEWSFSFHSHWGTHVVNALVALHAAAIR